MSNTLSIEDKIALAQTASAVEIDHLEDFCIERGLPLQDVTSWSTAFETGGKLAVQALVLNWSPERRRLRALHERVKTAVKVFRPRRMRVTVEGNHFSVDEVKPLTSTNIVHTPFFQLRLVDVDGTEHWFLYWRRAGGSWWPTASQHEFSSLEEAVQEVVNDPHYCFKLHPLH